jgi:hypothetical protein
MSFSVGMFYQDHAAVGDDTEAVIGHFIRYGYAKGPTD